ncbi:MAG: DnaJ domain-containing protein [Spirochaetaceae bacterium]|nr:DnaJ domain-containing protein [Spirochaetaceae bacterium]
MFLFNKVKKSYYETLGVPETAGGEEIKRAYFGLVRKYQPDRFPEEFKEIRAAYETLMDKEKRAEYDAVGELPSSVAPLFYEAQRFDRFGRHDKAAELYQLILKSHPELDNVREACAESFYKDDKPGKAVEVWEDLCRKHPKNPHYARRLGKCYIERGWHKKALAETRRAIALDPSSIDSFALLLSCSIAATEHGSRGWDELKAVSLETIEAAKGLKADEWEKIYFYTYGFITCGIKEIERARGYLKEIIRLIREGGRDGQEEGFISLKEILGAVPEEGLFGVYAELKEMADMLPEANNKIIRKKLETIRLNAQIESLVDKKYSEIFRDLFRILNADFEDDEDELEVIAIEHNLLHRENVYFPQIRRLREEFPELYNLHASFFNQALRTRDVDKMLYQREKKYKKLKRRAGIDYDDDEPEEAPPETVRRTQPKVGRNDPCPCGSGKKYKRCCGA